MGLIAASIYSSPRSSLLGGTAVGSLPVARPVWSSVGFRRAFHNDLCSFPSGLYANAIVLPMKLGGMSMRAVRGTGAFSGQAIGAAKFTFSGTGSGALSLARIAGTKWTSVSVAGSGALSLATMRSQGYMTINVRIGFQPSADDIAFAVLGLANGIESGLTLKQAMRGMSAVLLGKSSAGGTTFRDVNDTKDRITGTVDGSGNRTAVTKDLT